MELSSFKIKKILLFQEIELSSSKIKKFLKFSEMEIPNLIFFLIFQEETFQGRKIKKNLLIKTVLYFGNEDF